MRVRLLSVLFLMFFVAVGCGPLQRNSPFSEQTISTAHRLNSLNIEQLLRRDQTPQDIYMGLLSDSHQNYDDLEYAIEGINSKTHDFVAHLGDFTNQGYNIEYDLFLFRIKNLGVPFVTVLGNHDTLVKGKSLYQRIFGNFNESFDYRGYRFIILNNNRLDFYSTGGVDWTWLRQNVQSSTLPIVIMHHINPDNKEYFADEDRQTFWNIVSGSRTRLVLHGHQHIWITDYTNGVLRHQVNRTEGGRWSRVLLQTNSISIERCTRMACSNDTTQAFP
ncbi:MAG: metallophosphoesterase [Bdellovibrio sp.]